MDNFMYQISNQSILIMIILLLAAVMLIIMISRILHARSKIKKEAAACAETSHSFQSAFRFSMPPKVYSAHFGLVKNLSVRYGINLPVLMHIDDFWITKFAAKPSSALR